jgi:signal transduction histidine kinase/DNA-binding LacI/PurR family transcriptional regulator/AraC-like DNA-binding protein
MMGPSCADSSVKGRLLVFERCERPTIGFLTANIHIGAARALWPGVVEAARQRDVNLLCFPGGGLRVQAEFESQRNVLYDLVSADNVDGLVSWASTIGMALDPDEVINFHKRYSPLPIVSLALPMDGIPALSVNSYEGMRVLMAHLIEAHGFRRLAFIRGPEGHYYAQERYRAYTDTLQQNGIAFAPDLVTRPVQWDAGAEAVQMLLDERKLRPQVDFEAVVAVSDLLALGAIKTLQARGIQVPGDVAVVGFNDSVEGRLTTPPLTSVALPFYEQGHRAAEMLLTQLEGQPVPEQVFLPSTLMVRQSCGCPAQSVMQAAAGLMLADEPFEVAWSARRDALVAELTRAGFGEWAGQLLEALAAGLRGESPTAFVHALEHILRQVSAQDGDVAVWQGAVSILRRHALASLSDQARSQAEDLLGQARVLIGEMAQRAQAYRQLQAERQSEMLREIGQALITTFDVDRLADVLAERLPALGIASCYLALYKNPRSSLERSRLVLAYTEQGRAALEPGGRQFLSRRLAPDEMLPERRHSYVVEPLYFQDEQIGFVLFEIGPRDGTVYEVLRAQISSALKGALLFQQAQQARLAAEKADRIKTRLLANVSHELRTPLNIILGYIQDAQSPTTPYGIALPPALLNDLQHIQHSAEHQLRVVNDLLDLSRAEIEELDLYLELLDPCPLLQDAFHSLADQATSKNVEWHLRLPDRLPMIRADPVRLRQVLLNLMSNARKFTERGHITLSAEVSPPHLHIWVKDTGLGIPAEQQERIFEPFVTAEHDRRQLQGMGLGLSITRRLVMLHGGSMSLDSQPGQGSTFHVYLLLPSPSDRAVPVAEQLQPVLLLVSALDQPADQVLELCQRHGLAIRRLQIGDDVDAVLRQTQPAALAWDLSNASPGDWAIVRRLRNHPRLCQSPFILYGPEQIGLTSFVVKPATGQALLDAIEAARPAQSTGSILIVDDDPQARSLYQRLVGAGLPGYSVCTAGDGQAALENMTAQVPSLVILDLMMPEMDGFDVLDRMRADPQTRHVPVVILSNKLITLDDVKRLEGHALVTLQSKGILSEAEIVATLNRALFGADTLPPQTSALVKRAIAYLHQNYARPLSRWEIAEAIGVSQDYLSRVFNRELGLSPWSYLNRYRIGQAKALLRGTSDSVQAIAHQVGFKDQAYFSRVFHSLTGVSPRAFREHPEA